MTMTKDQKKWGQPDDGEVLNTLRDWRLVKVPRYPNWESWVVHGCDPKHRDHNSHEHHELGVYCAGMSDGKAACFMCGQDIPAQMLTLWKLHNFECIQRAE